MNFNAFFQQSESKNDFDRLMQLCSSYGLNEEQTNQIIADFKNGSFCNDQSIDESFQQSLKGLDYEYSHRSMEAQETVKEIQNDLDEQQIHAQFERDNEDGKKSSDRIRMAFEDHLHEEYSFKDAKNPSFISGKANQLSFEDYELQKKSKNIKQEHDHQRKSKLSQQSIHQNSQSLIGEEAFENFIRERQEFENHIYHELENEKNELKSQLRERDSKIDLFMKMKVQDSEIILGLKDTISKMAEMLKQRDEKMNELQNKMEKQREKSEQLAISLQKMSKSTFTGHHQQSTTSLDEKRSINSKQNMPMNNYYEPNQSNGSNRMKTSGSNGRLSTQKRQTEAPLIEKKPSDKNFHQNPNHSHSYLRDISKHQISKSNINLKAPAQQNRSGIDISKYKGMIQRLRNSYEFK